MIRKLHLLPDLLGKICKLHPLAKKICKQDEIRLLEGLFFFQDVHVCKMVFSFVNEPPWYKDNDWWYCVQDSELKDWHWFPLNYLMICE